MEITRESIVAAASRISGHIRSTPVLALDSRSHSFPGRLVLKLEHLQVAGSFKARGAFNLLISRAPSSVVAASGGNFGFALGHAARELEIEADIFVPRTSPEEKITAVRSTGSNVHVIPGFYDDALAASQEHARRTGAEFAHAFDLPEVVAGAGTCALEIATQVPEVDTLLVAVGGGGLIAGVASWFRDRARVVGVETTGTPTLHAARSAGEPVQVEVSGIAVSALGAARIGDIAWEAAQRWVDESLLIEDDDVRGAQQWLWETARVVAEPAGATPIAALLSGAYVPAANETVVALISGANTSPGSVANSQP